MIGSWRSNPVRLRGVAVLLFAAATLIALAHGDASYRQACIAGGLMVALLSTVPAPHRPPEGERGQVRAALVIILVIIVLALIGLVSLLT